MLIDTERIDCFHDTNRIVGSIPRAADDKLLDVKTHSKRIAGGNTTTRTADFCERKHLTNTMNIRISV